MIYLLNPIHCVRNGYMHPKIIFLTFVIKVQLMRKMLSFQVEILDCKR